MAGLVLGVNDLVTKYPNIVEVWDYSKNIGIQPTDFTYGSNVKVWWLCSHGHSYQQRIYDKVRLGTNSCPICSGQRVLQGYNDLSTMYPQLAREWNFEKNGTLLPTMVHYGSHKKVWWCCRNGHTWKTAINIRTQGYNCPYCSGRLVKPDLSNSLAKVYPDVALEWNYVKNQNLTPEMVTFSSNKKVWWNCSKGHSYEMQVDSRTGHKQGCPYCSGKKILIGFNSLSDTHPQIANEWDYLLNTPLRPTDVTAGMKRKVYWKCNNGHNSYNASILNRTFHNSGCPVCANKKVQVGINDLASVYPYLCDEWDYEKNEKMPQNYISGSHNIVWWKCSKNHSYSSRIEKRILGQGCPFCAGKKILIGFNDLATVNPDLVKEWNYRKNDTLIPQMFTEHSGKKVWWICEKGHEWQAQISNRSNGSGCPICNSSRAEKLGSLLLIRWNIEFLREYSIKKDFKVFYFDFYLPSQKVFIEFDGLQHFQEDTSWFNATPFEKRILNDNLKNIYGFENDLPILRLPYSYDIKKDKLKIASLMQDFIKTKRIPQEIINFYVMYNFSNYAKLASSWNKLLE